MDWFRRIVCLGIVLSGPGCGDDNAGDGSGSTVSGSGSASESGSASVGTSASTSATGSGSASASGSGSGGQPDVTCVANTDENIPTGAGQPDPSQQHSASGDNGTFTDECDGDGNLIEYVCDVISECDAGPNPACTYYQSGDVVPMPFDCAGQCVDGTCPARCPAFGDMLQYTAINGDQAEFDNLEDGRHYACTMSFDQANDTYDCLTDPTVGSTAVISALGLQGQWCTGTQAFNIGTGEPQQCSYMCEMVPT